MSALPAPDASKFPHPLPQSAVRTLPAGTIFGRIYDAGGAHAARWHELRHFGPTGSRFDHHPDPVGHYPDHAVTYVTPQIVVPPETAVQSLLLICVSECFSDRGVIERGGVGVGGAGGTQPRFVLFATTREITLLDLVDSTWVTDVGGNGQINTGDRSLSRPWARAIHQTYPDADGVFYRPRTIAQRPQLPEARAVALWERAEDALPVSPITDVELSSPGLTVTLESYAKTLGLGLA